MNPGKVIVMTACRRPEVFAETLGALAACHGVEAYKVLVFIDGGYPEARARMSDTLAASPLCSEVICQPRRLGADRNTFEALDAGFSHPVDWVILLEEDLVPAADFLVFMEQALEGLEGFDPMFAVHGYCPSVPFESTPGEPWVGFRDLWDYRIGVPFLSAQRDSAAVGLWSWVSWGLGLWRSRWEDNIARQWWDFSSWDVNMCLLARGGRLSAFPLISRIQNIGIADGVTPISEATYRESVYTDNFYSDSPVTHFEVPEVRAFLDSSQLDMERYRSRPLSKPSLESRLKWSPPARRLRRLVRGVSRRSLPLPS